MTKHTHKQEVQADLTLPNTEQLSSMNTKSIFILGNKFFTQAKYQEAIKLYQIVTDKENAGSLKWLEASEKLADIHFDMCRKLISDEVFKMQELSSFRVNSTKDIEKKGQILLDMHFSDANENYYRCIQKSFGFLKDLYDFDKEENLLQDAGSAKMRDSMVAKIKNVIFKSLQLNTFYYTEVQCDALNQSFLYSGFYDAMDNLSSQLSNGIDSELDSCRKYALSMIGDTNSMISE